MMKWNDWVRLKNINVIKHGGKLNVIFSQSPPRKENEFKRMCIASSSTSHHQFKRSKKVVGSLRSKLHESIDRIKKLSVPSCEGQYFGSKSPVALVTSSASPLQTNVSHSSIQHHQSQTQPQLTSFPWLQAHPMHHPQILPVKTETDFEASCDSLSNKYKCVSSDQSVMEQMRFIGKNSPPSSQKSSKIKLHDLHTHPTRFQHESFFPVRTTDHFLSPHTSYYPPFKISPHYRTLHHPNLAESTCSSISTSSVSDSTDIESSPALSLPIPPMTNMFRDSSLTSTRRIPETRHSSSFEETQSHKITHTVLKHPSTSAPSQIKHLSDFEEVQPFKLMSRQEDTSQSSASVHDMYDIPDREISWSVRQKLINGEKLLDSERIRLMDVVYNHVTKFTFYPSTLQYSLIVNSFLKKFPSLSLTERGTADIAELWKKRLKRKFQNVRARRDSRVPCVQRQKIGKRSSKCFQMTSSMTTDSCWKYPQENVSSDGSQPTVHTRDTDDAELTMHTDGYDQTIHLVDTDGTQLTDHPVDTEEETDTDISDEN